MYEVCTVNPLLALFQTLNGYKFGTKSERQILIIPSILTR